MRASFCRWRCEFPRVRWWVPVKHKKAFQQNLLKLLVFPCYGPDKHLSYKSQLPLKKQSPPQIQHSDSQVCVSDIQTVKLGSCPYFSLLTRKGCPSLPNIIAHICHEYHELYSWKKTVMWRNFSFLYRIWTIYGVLSKFMPFLFKIYVEKNLCGENLCEGRMTNISLPIMQLFF